MRWQGLVFWCVGLLCTACQDSDTAPLVVISPQRIVIPATSQALHDETLRELQRLYLIQTEIQERQQERQFVLTILFLLAVSGVSLAGLYLWLGFKHPPDIRYE